jgi:hypothetical protein
MSTPYCHRSALGGHACSNYQPINRCLDCPLRKPEDPLHCFCDDPTPSDVACPKHPDPNKPPWPNGVP